MNDKPKRSRNTSQLTDLIVERSTMDADALREHREKLFQKSKDQKPGNLGSNGGGTADASSTA